MSRHGWVKPLPGGAVARCGGPGMCAHCKAERIVALRCPSPDNLHCYYCNARVYAPDHDGFESHTAHCPWLPFAEAFS